MTEQQILKKIDSFDENDKIQAIIDFVESLPVEQRTVKVLSELGRAYNNLYWLEQSVENENYLRKAIEVFKYIEDDLCEDASWNYRIGYSYFFLNNQEEAKKHFLKYEEISGEKEEFLGVIEMAQRKGISTIEVLNGGKAGIEFPLEKFQDYLKNEAPKLARILGNPMSEEEIWGFESRYNIKLPEDFKQLHLTFSGQKDKALIFHNEQRFVSLGEIPKIKEEWLDFVKKNFGENWEDIRIPEDNFIDGEAIKNQLYNEKWLPILAGEYLLCVDLDNEEGGMYGQIIMVNLKENIKDFKVSHLFYSTKSWLAFLNESLDSGYLKYEEEKNYLKFNSKEEEPALYSEEEINALENYMERAFGDCKEVMHEIVSPDIHCDIYIIEPTPEKNYYTLVTCGMGAYQMNTPEGYEDSPYAELVINLPPDWDIKSEEEKDYWPIRWLKLLSRLAIEQNTYLAWGHTIPTGEPLEGTGFDCIMLVSTDSKELDEEGIQKPARVTLPSGKEIVFYTLMPIYPQEVLYKLNHRAEGLMDKFAEADIPYPPIVDVDRLNTCLGYQPQEIPNLLDNIAWSFNKKCYLSLMTFWKDIQEYNRAIGNNIEDFNPFATLFQTSKVKVMYDAYIESENDLAKNEILLNPEIFDESNKEKLYPARILAEFTTDSKMFGALDFLRYIHNALFDKDLGEYIFFEGFEIEGFEEDGTPAVYLLLGS